ncbi:MAG: NAD(P)H-hydrate dehydratase [Candidatus Aenigmatarchaeota archaeon]|nr:NAD(P)H-hydrate dehydratase [Candidatus Aenigmarchaeota archaeon]
MLLVNKNLLKTVYKKRDDWSRKYNFGSLLVIGGSKIYSGSPTFNALAAYRAGVDLVTVAAPERAANIIASFSPDIVTYPLKGDFLTRRHVPELLKLSHKKTACVIGGGLGREKETLLAVLDFIEKSGLPCVIDADAIHALQLKPELAKNHLITPHAREFFVLTGLQPSTHLNERIRYVEETAKRFQTTIVLKGHIDVIASPEYTAINKTGSTFMTKGGFGDTLAGICGALLARGIDTFTAGCLGAYINGLAGEMASKKFGESVMASDLIKEIPNALKGR